MAGAVLVHTPHTPTSSHEATTIIHTKYNDYITKVRCLLAAKNGGGTNTNIKRGTLTIFVLLLGISLI